MKLKNKFRFCQKVSIVMVFLMVNQIVFPVAAMALTSGPTQPEVNDFEPVGTSQMVDLFSGDFTYNIPLFELPGPDGGYPFNLAYHSGISMDQEASWVGLGWTMNHGAITRNMRGLPDDFNGDKVAKKMDMRPNKTWDFRLKSHLEFWGYKPAEKATEEVPATEGIPGNLSLDLALSVSHNSYKGLGFGAGLDFGTNFQGDGFAFNGGLGLDVNSFEGADIKPKLSFGSIASKIGALQLGASMNSRQGLRNLSLGYSRKMKALAEAKGSNGETKNAGPKSVGGNASYTFAKNAFSPQVAMPYRGYNITGYTEFGGWTTAAGIGVGAEVGFNTQRLKDRNTWVSAAAYGYFHLRNRGDNQDRSILDFNRSNDGAILGTQPNLATPMTTPDLYSVMGQGIGAMYRPYRSDIGILTDPYMQSKTGGFRLAGEFNFGVGFDLGVDLGGNWANSKTDKWDAGNVLNPLKYDGDGTDENYEPYYFKSNGEASAEDTQYYNSIGKDKAAKLQLENGVLTGRYEFRNKNTISISDGKRATRKPRSTSIQPITNKELMFASGEESMAEYRIDYYQANESFANPPSHPLQRDAANHPDHVAGITALQGSGMRYVYGLPAKNHEQQEITYSHTGPETECGPTVDIEHNGSSITYKKSGVSRDDYLSITKIPEYTHSFLLTSVLGADYADIDGIPGPSDGDFGYWVKFSYVKTSDNYKWKAPYHGANLLVGGKSSKRDDKASFMYGERDQYYLARAETKTHVAEFDLTARKDARGATGIYQNDSNSNSNEAAYSYRLDAVSLYSKLATTSPRVALKKIHFGYDYTLCANVDNNITGSNTFDGTGKLSLKQLHFTYENSGRGALSPYLFGYGDLDNTQTINPNYNTHRYDRWGNYKDPNTGDDCEHQDFPYTDQYRSQAEMDAMASVWHLREIQLPSGAKIEVQYEADDYAYVQDRTAMQMFKMTGVEMNGGSVLNPVEDPTLNQRKIYFELEKNIPVGLSADALLDKYFEDLQGTAQGTSIGDLLYYKILTDINESNSYEYVSGYAELDTYGFGDAVNGEYTHAYVVVKPAKIGKQNKERNYHPFLASAWQKLKLEYPEKMNGEAIDIADGDFNAAIKQFVNSFSEIKNIFQAYYKYCADESFGTKLRLNKSFIRLNTPDKIKYGGGVRVKQVVLNDQWDVGEDGIEDSSTYGQVYEYRMKDKNGLEISSGVATNEPAIGYDECALRTAKRWTYSVYLKSIENNLFEYPINESYYPGPSVGYSKVTVKSLATAYSLDAEIKPSDIEDGFGSTGITINEFYTAKDFPIFTEETELDPKVREEWIPFGIGTYKNSEYTGSQGYAITLNDMHGKPHKVTHLGQDKNNEIIADTLSQVIYTYAADDVDIQTVGGKKRAIRVLNNMVDVLLADEPGATSATIRKQQLGVDYEFFTDMRESSSNAGNVHVGLQVDYIPPFIFGISGWPNFNYTESKTRTAVTNKIIRKSGILVRTDAYDGQSHIVTHNKVFDPLTGQVLLSTVNNNYDKEVYSYNIPARFAYENMGAAYENWGTEFITDLVQGNCPGEWKVTNIETAIIPLIKAGDEVVFTGASGTNTADVKGIAYLEDIRSGDPFLKVKAMSGGPNMQAGEYHCKVVRSGKRNHLTASVGGITTLDLDPTSSESRSLKTTNVVVPLNNNNNETIPVTYNTVDQVLGISAVTYSDCWDLERDECSGSENKSGYELGTKGVWKPHRTYAYVTNRGEDEPTANQALDLATQGVVNNVPIFNWENPFFTFLGDTTNWKMTNEVTKYGINGAELANRNILGQYSAALYAYKDNLPIAVGTNADYYEMGFESFEEFPTTIEPGDGSTLLGNGNIDFPYLFNQGNSGIEAIENRTTKKYNLVNGFKANSNILWVDKTFVTAARLPSSVILHLTDTQGRNYERTYNTVLLQNAVNSNLTLNQFLYQGDLTEYIINGTDCSVELPATETFTGYATLVYCNDYVQVANCCDESNESDGCIAPFFLEIIDAIDCMLHTSCDENGKYPIYNVSNSSYFTGVRSASNNGQDIDILNLTISPDTLFNNDVHFRGLDNVLLEELCFLADLSNPRVDLSVTNITDYTGILVDVRYTDGSVGTLALGDGASGLYDCDNGTSGSGGGNRPKVDAVKKQGNRYAVDPGSSAGCSSGTSSITLNSGVAHTGSKSLLVNEDLSFEQRSMQLIPGKEYIISAWVHRPNVNQASFADGSLGLQVEMSGTAPVFFSPKGAVVEGWQRIEGRFTYQENYKNYWVLSFKVGTSAASFDDLRVYPLSGNMQTYVYDPVNYRLKALLDNNNFASLYHYDEEGNLFLVKKETERGIKTIQASKNYIQPN